jgi:chemotaxis protein methyltransferase CheR
MTARTTSSWRAATGVPDLTEHEFDGLRALVRRHTGIHLNASKKALLYGRLSRRIRELGLTSFADYLRSVREDADECKQMIDRVTTNETRFFREPTHFAYLESTLLPAWLEAAASGARSKDVRAWSAGCSTGEEPYSLAMTLHDRLPANDGWSVEVLASDISTRVLETADQATWPIERAGEIPELLLKRHMLQGVGSQAGKMRASPELRRAVRVERLNLIDEQYSVRGPFDVIFCRNVLIYFDQALKRRVVERLSEHLAPGGHLFVGHAESIHEMPALSCVWPTVYARRDKHESPRRSDP